jgi:DNA-binding response OmpR family regulator
MSRTILFVEDNIKLLEINRRMFEMRGYSVLTASNLNEAREILSHINETSCDLQLDILVLDIMLPDGGGIDFCREVRGMFGIPILFLSILSDKNNIVSALKAGGDDYLTKPFDFDELDARIEALLRRTPIVLAATQDALDELELGGVKLDSLSGRAYIDGNDARLTHMEFSLLKLLIRKQGRLISNEDIYKLVWVGDSMFDYRTVKQHIYNIRKKLWEAGTPGFKIESSRNAGYRLILQNKLSPSNEYQS